MQKHLQTPNPTLSTKFPLSSDISTLHSVLTPSYLPTCWDAQHASLQSRLQAIFLLEGATESSSSNHGCVKDLTANANPKCPAFLGFPFPWCLDYNSLEKGHFFTLTHSSAVPHTPTGLRINASGCLRHPDDFEDCHPAHSVPLHHHITTANFFSLSDRKSSFYTLLLIQGLLATLCPNLHPSCISSEHSLMRHTPVSLEPLHIRTLPPSQREESHTANPLLVSCKGWQTSPALTSLQWDDFLFYLGDCSPGPVSSRICASISVKSHLEGTIKSSQNSPSKGHIWADMGMRQHGVECPEQHCAEGCFSTEKSVPHAQAFFSLHITSLIFIIVLFGLAAHLESSCLLQPP